MSELKISIVVPTFSNVELLKKCLRSLEKQNFPPRQFEVIIINDGSLDKTEEFLCKFKQETSLLFRYISTENKGVSSARNTGIKYAKGEFIAFADDDCILPENWLRAMYETFENAASNIAGVGGPLDTIQNRESYVTRYMMSIDEFNFIPTLGPFFIKTVHSSKLRGDEQIPYLRTSNSMFRKRCLGEVGAFDNAFKRPGGEDPDLCYRLLNLNYQFIFNKEIIVLHHARKNLFSYFRTLRSYINGEIRKGEKKHLYNNPVIKRSYSFIPLQKLISILLALLTYPKMLYKLSSCRNYKISEIITFPLITIVSKGYAFIFASYFQAKHLLSKQ